MNIFSIDHGFKFINGLVEIAEFAELDRFALANTQRCYHLIAAEPREPGLHCQRDRVKRQFVSRFNFWGAMKLKIFLDAALR